METFVAVKRKSPFVALFQRAKSDESEDYPSLKKQGQGRFLTSGRSLAHGALPTLLLLFFALPSQASAQ
ncbi:MAG: hypothetical protein ACXWW4_07770, partial [Candidatus Binatia bacterium]